MGRAVSGERPWRRSRRRYAGAAPAVATDWSVTVPAGKVWELISLYAQLVTDINVAARSVKLSLGDGDANYLVLPPAGTQAASLTYEYAWLQHGAAYAAAVGIVGVLPRLFLMAGWTLAVSTSLIQAGDQWTAPQLLVIETTVKAGQIDIETIPAMVVEVVSSAPA